MEAVAVATAVGALAIKRYCAGPKCKLFPDLTGKVAVVTGSNKGLGFHTAKGLAQRKATVVLACRSLDKARAAAERIVQETGNKNVHCMNLDLGHLATVRSFTDEFRGRFDRLDILDNNGGILAQKRWTTNDGFESAFGVNHLGHFALTVRLLDLLTKSKARVLTVSSSAHRFGSIHWDDLQLEKKWDRVTSYNQSKLANAMFTNELAKRYNHTGLTATCMNCGYTRTNIGKGLWTPSIMYPVFMAGTLLIGKSEAQGAQTSLQGCLDSNLPSPSYLTNCRPVPPTSDAVNSELCRRLWEVSEELTGEKAPRSL